VTDDDDDGAVELELAARFMGNPQTVMAGFEVLQGQ
jgi:hypothetical protein